MESKQESLDWFIIMHLVYSDGNFLRVLRKHRFALAPWADKASGGPLSSLPSLTERGWGRQGGKSLLWALMLGPLEGT